MLQVMVTSNQKAFYLAYYNKPKAHYITWKVTTLCKPTVVTSRIIIYVMSENVETAQLLDLFSSIVQN